MKKQAFFCLGLILFWCSPLPLFAQSEQGSHWRNFVDARESPGTIGSRQQEQATPYAIISVEAGTKLYAIGSGGVEILRQLDDQHFIIRHLPSQNKRFQQPFILKAYPANNLWKLSPDLFQRKDKLDLQQLALFNLKVRDREAFIKKLKANVPGLEFREEYTPAGLLQVHCSYATLFNHILPLEQLSFVDEVNTNVREESLLRDANLTINKINLLHHEFPQLNGSGMVVSVKEKSFDTGDLDLRGRHLPTEQASNLTSRHATEMATILAGGGNSASQSKGVAWAATLTSADFARLLPDPEEYFREHDISVQNHSYGTAIENYYGGLAHAYDVHTHRNPTLVHVFSAGNEGEVTENLGIYKNIKGFANLSGNAKMAKNTLVVGAIDSLKKLDTFVSKGPAYDGRIKPELVAYSTEGSSNATALVAGVVSLLQQHYRQEQGKLPAAALLKAVMVNTAEDVGPLGIDFYSGYGNVNAYKALQQLQQKHYFTASLAHQQEIEFPLNIPSNARNLKVTLAWTDPAAEPNAQKALVNDLDLSLRQDASGKSWQPWVLNAYPHPDSLLLPAHRMEDHLNTIEQVSLQQPRQGAYTLKVSGFDLPTGSQEFFVSYQWDEADNFSWTYPTGSDNMPYAEEKSSIFQWESSYSTEKGVLEYSLDKGESWQLIARNLDLSQGFYSWQAPELYATAMARMKIGEKIHTSDPFSISRPLKTVVGFNCQDSVMLSWHPVKEADAYTVYAMGEKYLEPISLGQDTFFIFQKQELAASHFAVAPRFSNQLNGLTSPAFDYTSQGVNCYLAFFNGRLTEEGVQLALGLGTHYGIEKLHFERKVAGDFIAIHSQTPNEIHHVGYLDQQPLQGPNEYRVRLAMKNGQEILSEEIRFYFLSNDPFLVFPNPVGRQEQLRVYSKDFNAEKVYLTLYAPEGKTVLEKEMYSDRETVSIASLYPGLYFYTLKAGNITRTGKILIY